MSVFAKAHPHVHKHPKKVDEYPKKAAFSHEYSISGPFLVCFTRLVGSFARFIIFMIFLGFLTVMFFFLRAPLWCFFFFSYKNDSHCDVFFSYKNFSHCDVFFLTRGSPTVRIFFTPTVMFFFLSWGLPL